MKRTSEANSAKKSAKSIRFQEPANDVREKFIPPSSPKETEQNENGNSVLSIQEDKESQYTEVDVFTG